MPEYTTPDAIEEELTSHKDVTENDGEEVVDTALSTLRCILLKSLLWMFMHRCIAHCSDTAQLPLHNVPFMNSMLADLASDELEMF